MNVHKDAFFCSNFRKHVTRFPKSTASADKKPPDIQPRENPFEMTPISVCECQNPQS